MILIKGDAVAFAPIEPPASMAGLRTTFVTVDGKRIDAVALPKRFGIIHDPTGKQLPRCEVYFGPYRIVGGKIEMTREAQHYFGRSYNPRRVIVDRPKGPWDPVAHVVKIFYVRKGRIAPGAFHHTFKGQPLELSRSGKFFRLALRDGCIVDDRGFVFP